MATKTVVCPECGSPAGPGRYACAECGAMLAAVGPARRGRRPARTTAADRPSDAASDAEPVAAPAPDLTEVAESSDVAELDAPAVADPSQAATMLDAESESEFAAEAAAEPAVSAEPGAPDEAAEGDGIADAAAQAEPAERVVDVEPAGTPDARNGYEPDEPMAEDLDPLAPFDENAPLAAARRSRSQPDVLHDLPDAPPTEAGLPSQSTPTWPPLGDLGPLPAPEPRTPAGAYLPPSAVLPPLDGAIAAPAGRLAAGAAVGASGADAFASTASSWAGRAAAALTNPVRAIRISTDAARQSVAVGAGIAALGILLPWVNTLPGASPVANYLERWGLAGAGVWLVLVGLVALASIAAASGRVASWPVGLPAIAIAAFLVGLVWPYALGSIGRPLGIWVVVIGALILVVGGLLARRPRHDRGDASV